MNTDYTLLITDTEHEFYNKRLQGFCAYYDIYHTGSGPDLYYAKTPQGNEIKLLTDQIDINDYNSQKLTKEINRLGANVGDIVIITRLGSGSSSSGFDLDKPHIISEIAPNGHIIFDKGKASGFQPDVYIYKGEMLPQTDFSKDVNNNGLPF